MDILLSLLWILHIEFSKLKLDGATVVPLNCPSWISECLVKQKATILTIGFVEEISPCPFFEKFLRRRT